MADLTLVIGTRAWSSWSLRPWLALKQCGAEFDEILVPLRSQGTTAEILAYSPAGKVPILQTPAVTIWDSLAICEYAAETFGNLWPKEPTARAVARSVSAEMHSSFTALRTVLPMDLLHPQPNKQRTPECDADIARIVQLWRDARSRYGAGGPFLFGRFSVADAMYAPVCTRFDTYGVPLDPEARAYVDTVLALPAMRDWYAAAAREGTPDT